MCPHKPGTRQFRQWEAREAKRRVREAEAAERAQERATACEQARALLQLPAQLGDWGVIRTRAWSVAQLRLRRALAGKRPSVAKLGRLGDTVRRVVSGKASDEQCARIVEGFDVIATE